MEKLSIYDKIKNIGIVPVIKLQDTNMALPLANSLIAGGINCAEVTFRAAGAGKVIKTMTENFPDMLVGAGTVLTVEQVDEAIDAGAMFCVSPGLNPQVVLHCLSKGVPFIPGVATASEIEQALALGICHVKFFPAEQAGGIDYIKALCGPYSNVYFMPTGGINIQNLEKYVSFKKVFACGGSWMVKEDYLANADFDTITKKSLEATELIKKARGL